MEQQTVTIAKAGIHAALNARCSVIAAANPIYGQYDKSRRPQENIGLPDSLLSRFDLLFVVLDQLDPTFDKRLSEHVIHSHQYRRPGTIMEPESLNAKSQLNLDDTTNSGEPVDSAVWQRSANGTTSVEDASGRGEQDLLSKDFLRKYIHFCKSRISPVLTEEANERITADYANMRANQSQKNLPVTARTLETIIRLASANAKGRLSQHVEVVDVEAATELLNFVLFHEIGSSSPSVIEQAKKQAVLSNRSSSSKSASAMEEDDEPSEEEKEADSESAENALLKLCSQLGHQYSGNFELERLTEEFLRLRPELSRQTASQMIVDLETNNKVCNLSTIIIKIDN